MLQEKWLEKKSKKDKWFCLLKMSEVKMREMPKSAANLNRGTSKRERERESIEKTDDRQQKEKKHVHAKRNNLLPNAICQHFQNVFRIDLPFFFSSCKLMNLTNLSTGPASAFSNNNRKYDDNDSTHTHIIFAICC